MSFALSHLLAWLRPRLEGKSVLVLGLGREGQSTLRFLLEHRLAEQIGVADQKQPEALSAEVQAVVQTIPADNCHWGVEYLQALPRYQVIFISPGISPFKAEFNQLKQDQELISQASVFLDCFRDQVIGVTGTKGKSTTASLIHHLLQASGISTTLLGNIGKPVFDAPSLINPETQIVFELSSHQLLQVSQSPHIAIHLNLYQEHLDYYPSLQEYQEAKAKITQFQTSNDYLILPENHQVGEVLRHISPAQIITLPRDMTGIEPLASWLATHPSVQPVSLQAARAVGKLLGLDQHFFKALDSFKELPHRVEFLGTFAGRRFYNDSLATIPEASQASLARLGSQVRTLIVGGFDRGQDMTSLADYLASTPVTCIIGLPETGHQLIDILESGDLNRRCYKVATLEEAVVLAYQQTPIQSACLMSPAAASFNQFADYKERGDRFRTLVTELAPAYES